MDASGEVEEGEVAAAGDDDKEDEDAGYKCFRDIDDMLEIKELMQAELPSKAAVPFNTNILRIALNKKEEKVAMRLVAYYQVEIEEKMIIRAIKTRQIKKFLYCVWAFNKNYEYKEPDEESNSDTDSGRNENGPEEDNYRTFTYDQLFKWILQYCEDDSYQQIRFVAEWAL